MNKQIFIKICPDPHCEAVWHNCPKKHTKCNDCGGNIILINEKTYWHKFSNNFFQYDFITNKIYRPKLKVEQLLFEFS
jgi:hypothetical protein